MAIKDFVYDSDYLMDYIVWKYEGTLQIGSSIEKYRIPHGLPYTPLVTGIWSKTPDFAVTNEMDWGGGVVEGAIMAVAAKGGDVIIYGGFTKEPMTVYFRIIGFRDPSFDGNVEAISIRNDFRKNTDFNYPKIHLAGVINTDGATIYHNLGYIPQIRAWGRDAMPDFAGESDIIMPARYAQYRLVNDQTPHYIESKSGIEITNQTAIFHADVQLSPPFYYFIFGDNGVW